MTVTGTLRMNRGLESSRNEAAFELDEIVVGKDVLELISSAMYVDPMTVYREYVQNAADAIDLARQQGNLGEDEPGKVDISIDPATRTVRIRDNGSGIAWADFARRLTALGGSSKRGTSARGFRGVGRLAGLGYAQELIFRSRVSTEDKVSELRWDCRRLKAALRSADDLTGVDGLIRSVASLHQVDAGDYPSRFFEVELKGMIRLRSDRLMGANAIAEYLSQVAPVPFSPEFRFGAQITAALKPYVDLSELEIRIEGIEGPVYRPHRDSFEFADKQHIAFNSVQIQEIPGMDGDLAAIAWVLHHDYEGAVPSATLSKGLRLRSGNVQVGENNLLEELFPETRFNSWSVGEVHIFDRRIVPNGRRDHFEQNPHYHNLINQLTPTAREIARLCRTSSIRRKWLREFDAHRNAVSEKLDIATQGSLPGAELQKIVASTEASLSRMESIANMELLQDDAPDQLQPIVFDMRERIGGLSIEETLKTSPLSKMTATDRSMYERLFSLVYECSANRIAAKSLVDRMIIKLTNEL
ncbi:ATP-binding protein [Lacibacterium aquatile]|uniref:ATP-binding protein n=1 Tax=Lacibacterium aquatile TaxID=1168082 RepID=A0ABW5DU99_9PROT